ncbi:hypothetical protein FSW04_19065 [Baekduia soli]|uniref:Uncharacterized protein n=1 Tax=Baekduia soli TaxID=496014 RepID=A0A5B8U8Y2_9ACTN|nr:hypothetical protein [Baekduia soli]QEC49460.1 hypothetical protein FSW04_19065 [Baekduia soli]
MKVTRYVLTSAAVLAAGAGGAAAIAATSNAPKQAEQSVLNDAAKRLNVSPDDLRSALSAAENAQLDQAVRDGRLTQAQADAIKADRQKDGRVLGGGALGGPHGGRGFGGPGRGLGFKGGPGGALDAAATALGLKLADLHTKLESGKSIADVAKDQGKSLADVKAAITAGVTKELDRAVTDGKLTARQRTDILKELSDHLDDLVTRTPPKGGPGMRHGPRGHWR